MEIQRLIQMANEIGAFFEAEPDRAKAAKGVADHLKKFWEKRMLRQFSAHFHQQQGAGLSPLVLEALRQHGTDLSA